MILSVLMDGLLLNRVHYWSVYLRTYINLSKVREFESFKSGSFTRIEFRIIKRDGTHGCVGIMLHTVYADDFIDEIRGWG
jgi:hypothetical protein